MLNVRCKFMMLAGLGWLLILAPACVQRDRPHGAIHVAQVKADAEVAEVPLAIGNDAGPGQSGVEVSSPSLDGYAGPAGPEGLVTPSADASQPSLDGYWDLVSSYSAATGTTTAASSGSGVVYFHGGEIALYLDNGGTKTCGLSTYTLQGTTIVFVGGNADSLVVTDTTLRMTTLQAGGLFNNIPGDYSDFLRLATFSADGYGPCQ